jgi:C4-dicarboxylate-binding protein DctP
LPNDIRTELEKIIKEVTLKVTKFALDSAVKDKQTVVASGKTNIHTLSDTQKQNWVDAMKPVWAQFEKQVGKDNIRAVQACNSIN